MNDFQILLKLSNDTCFLLFQNFGISFLVSSEKSIFLQFCSFFGFFFLIFLQFVSFHQKAISHPQSFIYGSIYHLEDYLSKYQIGIFSHLYSQLFINFQHFSRIKSNGFPSIFLKLFHISLNFPASWFSLLAISASSELIAVLTPACINKAAL